MDFALRCNSLKCRAQLAEQAVVTTCSHIFCVRCAEAAGMSNTNSVSRTCPACDTDLINQDDAAVTNLSPSEDYKTSVLSGLNPTIIIECASRAMAFWTYQTTQEVFYQEFLMKSMTEKYQSLSGQMDKLIHNANSEVSTLREKISAMQLDNKDLEGKNQQLAEAYKKKCKDNGQLHKLYQQAKQRQATDLMAEAAEQDVYHVVESFSKDFATTGAARAMNANQGRARNDGGNGSNESLYGINMGTNLRRPQQAQAQATATRSHLPQRAPGTGMLYRDQSATAGVAPTRHPTPFRQSLSNPDPNAHDRGTSDYGVGMGMKFGRTSQGTGYLPSRNGFRGSGGSVFGGR